MSLAQIDRRTRIIIIILAVSTTIVSAVLVMSGASPTIIFGTTGGPSRCLPRLARGRPQRKA